MSGWRSRPLNSLTSLLKVSGWHLGQHGFVLRPLFQGRQLPYSAVADVVLEAPSRGPFTLLAAVTSRAARGRAELWNECEWEGDVVAVVALLSGVAQVVSHGVKVVGVHGEEGQEKDGEVQVEVKGEVEQFREKRSSWMAWRWNDGLKDDLSQCGCE